MIRRQAQARLGGCKTRENFNFSEKWKNSKISIMVQGKCGKFSRSHMMKRTTPLDSSREI